MRKKNSCCATGRKARLEFEEKKQDIAKVKKIQAVHRGRRTRQDLENRSKAAAKIAAVHRGNAAAFKKWIEW